MVAGWIRRRRPADDNRTMTEGALPDLGGIVRRGRRSADLSQRELAERAGVAPSTVARVEADGRPRFSLDALGTVLQALDLRLAVLDTDGTEVRPMTPAAVRDRGRRRYPAHLDVRLVGTHSGWWGDACWSWAPGYHPGRPTHTFDLSRRQRDAAAERAPAGTRPADHPEPHPFDDVKVRLAAERRLHNQVTELDRRRDAHRSAPAASASPAAPAASGTGWPLDHGRHAHPDPAPDAHDAPGPRAYTPRHARPPDPARDERREHGVERSHETRRSA